jgi:hypothetical protein
MSLWFRKPIFKYFYKHVFQGRVNVFGIETHYELDGQGMNSSAGEIFRICSDRPWGLLSLLNNG